MDDVTGRQAQENCLRLFGFEKLQPLLENQPGPRDTAQAQWRWHERQALWLSLAAKPQPPEGELAGPGCTCLPVQLLWS